MNQLINLLLVDMGNSSIKWGVGDRGSVEAIGAVRYRTAELTSLLDQHWQNLEPPGVVWVAAVAKTDRVLELTDWVEKNWGCNCEFMHTESSSCGVECAYQQPAALGVDRWAALIGGHRLYPEGFCVVDCGTATTLDVVDSSGRHLGGYILPGFEMMKTALLENTAIQDFADPATFDEWGKSTESSVFLGSRKAVIALIEHSVERLQAAGVCDPALLVTGSASREITSQLQIGFDQRDHLVLEGLLAYAEEKNS